MIDVQLLTTWAAGLLPFILGFLVLMVLDFATGALLAWYQGYFNWESAPRFLQTGVLYLWAWLTAEALAFMPTLLNIEIPSYGDALAEVAPKTIFAAIGVGKYVASMVGNIKRIVEIRSEVPQKPTG